MTRASVGKNVLSRLTVTVEVEVEAVADKTEDRSSQSPGENKALEGVFQCARASERGIRA